MWGSVVRGDCICWYSTIGGREWDVAQPIMEGTSIDYVIVQVHGLCECAVQGSTGIWCRDDGVGDGVGDGAVVRGL